MKSKVIVITLIIAMALSIIAYHYRSQKVKYTSQSDENNNSEILFGLVTGYGGLGDKAFNDMQFNGMLLAKRNFGIEFIYESPSTWGTDLEVLDRIINRGASVIIAGGGFHMIDPVDIYARKYPDIIFIILDDFAKEYLPNIATISYRQNEGSFLVGALSALETSTNTIAMIGATDIEIINDFYNGFEAGAKHINPNIKIFKKYIGSIDDVVSPFANPQKAQVIADDLYANHNVDIIYQVASGSGIGVFNSARNNKKFAIGVDSDQDYLAEGFVLTSMMKRLDLSINMIIEHILNETFENKAYKLGLKENGVSLSPMNFTKNIISQKSLNHIDMLKQDIIEGKIQVKTYFP